MFGITSDDVAQLNDEQLRELIGLLCESELRRKGHSPAAVTFGGNQNAADGGLDVCVTLPAGAEIGGFIPRTTTGFQVKRQDMPASAIEGEMAPTGIPRQSIADLANVGGAYVIVSSEGSTAHSALVRRRTAMAKAVEGLPNARALALDFYDRTRIATWIRDNPSSILWVRKAIGRPIQGWERYEAWSYPAGGLDSEYLADQGVKICPRPTKVDGDLSTTEGIDAIRNILRNPRTVVRLVGLSGVGKTRFAQALFDERIGANVLDRSHVFYTNMNSGPEPQPGSFASDLVAVGTRAILIVDNCSPELHARLAEIAKAPASQVSLLTVEYDIREDQPEGTDVYEVRAASVALIEVLLRNRFREISQVDAHTAAQFSGGNARIGIALAETVARGGSLQHLTDYQLFRRLFAQRHDHDQRLLETAQVCSLVYSFDTRDVSEAGELTRIGRMIGASADDVYRATAELVRRDLAQCRGTWRAILPHAIANRLATQALQDIPRARIEGSLANGAPERIQKSFSRRIGFLHESPEARALVSDWFSTAGRLSSVWNLNAFDRTLFENILPANPTAGLSAIERSVPVHDAEHPIEVDEYVLRALRSIAYDAALFDRAVNILQLVSTAGESGCAKMASNIHKSLFTAVLSGTHAGIEQRVAIAKRLMESEIGVSQTLGVDALDAMLKTMFFSSSYEFQFGAHSRDYGFRPATQNELKHWYRAALVLAVEVADSGGVLSGRVRECIGAHFRGLWSQITLWDELEDTAARLGANGRFWRDGWQAVKQTRQFDAKDKRSESYARLSVLEARLRPTDLVQDVRGRALGSRNGDFDVDDVELESDDRFGRAMERKRIEVEALGEALAKNPEALRELLPELVRGPGQLWPLGAGLAKGAEDPRGIWRIMVEQYALAGDEIDVRTVGGFLEQVKVADPQLSDELLDQALTVNPLAQHFPRIQSFVGIDQKGVDRLFRSLELGYANIGSYYNLSLGRATDRMSGESLARFVLAVGVRPGGGNVALQILHMQLFVNNQERRSGHSPELIAAGRELLTTLDLSRDARRDDYTLGGVVTACLSDNGGYATAKDICEKLLAAVAAHTTSGVEHNELLGALLKTQPLAALDTLLGGDPKKTRDGIYLLQGASQHQKNPIDHVSESVLLEWANRDPASRFRALASVVSVFTVADDKATRWTSLAGTLVHSAPDPVAVMLRLVERLALTSWSGSEASALESNANLLSSFDTRGNSALTAFVASHRARLLANAERTRDWENKRDKLRDEAFE